MATRRKMNWDGLADKLENAMKGKARPTDERFYQPKFDEEGSAQSIVRFLPSPDTDIPLVTIYEHKFRGAGGFYSEMCPTTIGQQCPVCKKNSAMWDTDKDTVRTRARKQKFVSNILIINDPATPENNGKVFLFRYDKKTYQKIIAKIKPKKGGIESPCNVFDYDEGANFKLIGEMKSVTIGGKAVVFPDYTGSSFAEPTALKAAEADAADKQLFPLAPFHDANLFKSQSELEEILDRVIGEQKSTAFVAPKRNSMTDFSANMDNTADETPSQTSNEPITDDAMEFADTDDDFIAKLKNRKVKK